MPIFLVPIYLRPVGSNWFALAITAQLRRLRDASVRDPANMQSVT